MKYGNALMAAGLLLSLTTLTAEASLTNYTANGVDLVRMQGAGFDVSFTKDGNLFQTLAASNANLVSQIAAVTPTYNDPSWGLQTIDTGDFNTSTGQMSWWGSKAFVNYLNNISYGGSNQWSLPGWTDTGAAGPQFGNNGTDQGYNVNTSSDPLAQLYYGELAKKGYYNTIGVGPQSGYGIFGNNGAQSRLAQSAPLPTCNPMRTGRVPSIPPNPVLRGTSLPPMAPSSTTLRTLSTSHGQSAPDKWQPCQYPVQLVYLAVA